MTAIHIILLTGLAVVARDKMIPLLIIIAAKVFYLTHTTWHAWVYCGYIQHIALAFLAFHYLKRKWLVFSIALIATVLCLVYPNTDWRMAYLFTQIPTLICFICAEMEDIPSAGLKIFAVGIGVSFLVRTLHQPLEEYFLSYIDPALLIIVIGAFFWPSIEPYIQAAMNMMKTRMAWR